MKKGIFIKGFIIAFILIISFSVLSGCSRLIMLDFETSRDDKAFQDMLNKVLAALDSGDKEELKALFAVSAIEKNPNLDNQIDTFFQVSSILTFSFMPVDQLNMVNGRLS